MLRPELTFDGFGINGPDVHRTRIATFHRGEGRVNGEDVDRLGYVFAAAPDLLAALERAVELFEMQPECSDTSSDEFAWLILAGHAISLAKGAVR